MGHGTPKSTKNRSSNGSKTPQVPKPFALNPKTRYTPSPRPFAQAPTVFTAPASPNHPTWSGEPRPRGCSDAFLQHAGQSRSEPQGLAASKAGTGAAALGCGKQKLNRACSLCLTIHGSRLRACPKLFLTSLVPLQLSLLVMLGMPTS